MAGNTLMSLLVKLGVDSAQFDAALDASKKSTTGLEKALGGMVKKMIMVAGPLAMGRFILGATKLAARVETLGIVTQTLGKTAGYTADQINNFEKSIAAQGITTQNTRQAMAQMIQAQIDLAEGADLARMAQDTGVIANINSSEAFQRLVTVLQTGNVQMGRAMGLSLQFGAAQERLAKELGITTADLDEQQIMQSRLNEVKKAGVAIEDVYTASIGTTGGSMKSMERHIENFKVAIGNLFLPALDSAIVALTDFFKVAKKGADTLGLLLNRNKLLTATLAEHHEEVKKSGGSYKDYVKEMKRAAEAAGKLAWTQAEWINIAGGAAEATLMMRNNVVLLTEAQLEGNEASIPFIEGFQQLAEAIAAAGSAAEFVGSRFDASYIAMRNATEGLKNVAYAAGTAGLAIDTGVGGAIGRFLDDMEFLIGGGMEIVNAFNEIQAAVEAGMITPEEGQAFAEELFVDAQQLQVDLDNITAREAATAVRDQLGGSLSDARKLVDAVGTGLGDLPNRIDILIKIRTEGEMPSGYQHGGSFMIEGPPGADQVPVFFMGTRGEQVDITPAGQAAGAQDNRQMFQGANVNINDPMARETVFGWINEWMGD